MLIVCWKCLEGLIRESRFKVLVISCVTARLVGEARKYYASASELSDKLNMDSHPCHFLFLPYFASVSL